MCTNAHTFWQTECLEVCIFSWYRYGYVCRCIWVAYTHVGCMHVWELKEHGRGKRCYVYVHVCVRTYILPCNPGICRRQNKNHAGAASRQPEIYVHSLLSPGRWMGPIWSPFTRSTMGVKEEEGCHTDMHRLEGRGIWKGLLRKPWWHDAEEKKERGLSLCFGCLK